jgi:hypothetical protein
MRLEKLIQMLGLADPRKFLDTRNSLTVDVELELGFAEAVA